MSFNGKEEEAFNPRLGMRDSGKRIKHEKLRSAREAWSSVDKKRRACQRRQFPKIGVPPTFLGTGQLWFDA